MARIGLDARMLDRTGIGTYLTELLPRLPGQLSAQDQLVVFGSAADRDRLRAQLRPADEVQTVSPRIYGPEEQITLKRAYARARLDLLHAPHYNQPINSTPRMVLTINDLIPLVFPRLPGNAATKAYNRLLLKRAVRRAARLIVPSAHTGRDLVERLGVKPERIVMIPDAAGPQFSPQRDPAAERSWLTRLGISDPYLLYLGQWKPYKNVPLLIDAFKDLVRDGRALQLVIGGRDDPRYREVSAAARDERIRLTGWLPVIALPHLIRAAAAFVLPSLYEGFGLPVLEAMACGTPVVCSRVTSLPEVAGDAAQYWEPASGRAGLVEAIGAALQPDTARRLRDLGLAQAARFSWDETAQRTVEVYRSLLS